MVEIINQHFVGGPGREAKEILDQDVIIRGCTFTGGSCLLRLNRCRVLVDTSTFWGALGPADPDGQCIQFINSTGSVTNCHLTASEHSEDLLSIYADKPVKGVVWVRNCIMDGRGLSGSSTSICCDGPYCPTTDIDACKIIGARCAITLAGGVGHMVGKAMKYVGCETEVYSHQFYKGPFGKFKVLSGKVQT